MTNKIFDYYYGTEAAQFSFFKIPKSLIKDEVFKGLSSDAKLLYGLMLDRMSLSMKNGWLDKENRVYIIYTVDMIMKDLGCSRTTCVKILKALDTKHGVGLIERKRRGLGKPDIIYVKNFTDEDFDDKNQNCGSPKLKPVHISETQKSDSETTEVQNTDTLNSSNYDTTEVKDLYPNKTNNSYTNINKTEINNPNLNQTDQDLQGTISGKVKAYMEIIRENIDYDWHMTYDESDAKSLFHELYDVICDVVCVNRDTVRVNREDYPQEIVKANFLKLKSDHLEFVIKSMKSVCTKIRNIRSYMITALYNASTTMNHYYQQSVQYEFYS